MWTIYGIFSPDYPRPCVLAVDPSGELRCYGPCLACLLRWLRSLGETRATIHLTVHHGTTTTEAVDLSTFKAEHLVAECPATTEPADVSNAGISGPVLVTDGSPLNRRARRRLEADARRRAKRRHAPIPSNDDIPA